MRTRVRRLKLVRGSLTISTSSEYFASDRPTLVVSEFQDWGIITPRDLENLLLKDFPLFALMELLGRRGWIVKIT